MTSRSPTSNHRSAAATLALGLLLPVVGASAALGAGTQIATYADPAVATRIAASPDGALLAVVTTFDPSTGYAHHVSRSSDLGASWTSVGPAILPILPDSALVVLGDGFYLATLGTSEDPRPTVRRFDVATGAIDPDFDRAGDAVVELALPASSERFVPSFLEEIEISAAWDGTLQVLALWNTGPSTYWRAELHDPDRPLPREVGNLELMPTVDSGLSLTSPSPFVPGLVSGIGGDGSLVLFSVQQNVLDGRLAAVDRSVPGLHYSGVDERTSLAGLSEASDDRAAFAVQTCDYWSCRVETRWTEDFFVAGGGDPEWSVVGPDSEREGSWGTVLAVDGGFVEASLSQEATSGRYEVVLRRFDWDGRLSGTVLRGGVPGPNARYELVDLGGGLVGFAGLDGNLGQPDVGAVFRLFDLGFFTDGFESGDLSAWSGGS